MTSEISPPPAARQQGQSRLSFSSRSGSGSGTRPRAPSQIRSDRSMSNDSRAGLLWAIRHPGHGRDRSRSVSRPPAPRGKTGSAAPAAASGGGDAEKSLLVRIAPSPWVEADHRARLPALLRRFSGYRGPSHSPPYAPLGVPPFSWLRHIPLKYETWMLSTFGAFVAIALIQVVMSAAFPNDDTILIVASFGASAVLCFGTIESPLSQPRHLVGGQVLSVLTGVILNRLFSLSRNYVLENTIQPGTLQHNLIWVDGALSMALSLLVMQITGTVHPPGGATAVIAAVQPAAVNMSWRLIYVVLISSLIMLVWAVIINNVGRRRYPVYWLTSKEIFIKDASGKLQEESLDEAEMAAEEGRSRAFELGLLPEEEDLAGQPAQPSVEAVAEAEKARGRTAKRQ